MLNRVVLIGRLTADPELRYTTSGTAVAKFTLAVNRKFNKEETDFINIVVWRRLAENCANYLSKGRLAAVEGRLQVRNYEDKDGQRRYVTEVVAEDVRFLESVNKASNNANNSKGTSADDWSDLGREISLEDIQASDDEIPL